MVYTFQPAPGGAHPDKFRFFKLSINLSIVALDWTLHSTLPFLDVDPIMASRPNRFCNWRRLHFTTAWLLATSDSQLKTRFHFACCFASGRTPNFGVCRHTQPNDSTDAWWQTQVSTIPNHKRHIRPSIFPDTFTWENPSKLFVSSFKLDQH